MPEIVPLTSDASQTMNYLGFDVLLQWNTYDNAWRMDIVQNGITIVNGIKLTCGLLLLQPYSLGIGDFYVLQNINNPDLFDPSLNSFTDGSYNLIYYTQDEINAIFA